GIFVVFWIFIMRQQGGGNSKVMSFGKSRAQVADPSKNRITFADVAGAQEEKEELQEMVDFLRNPKQYTELGARIPKGVILVGPPGTGKTLLAKAVAGEAKVPFFTISGSDFVEMFVGVGASRVRDLFEQAKRNAPSIVFIDEIDAVGRHRGAGMGGGHDEREQTLNQLLVEMDGFSTNEGVIVMAATNRRDILDPALLRPGRFDRQITVNYPDLQGREDILKVHGKGKKLSPYIDYENIAKRTPYATGADLENMMNEAAILTARNRGKEITQEILIDAIARVQMGPEKKSHRVNERDRKVVAYHETGHALVGHLLPHADDIHLITIVPRGMAAGHTLSLPEEERDNLGKKVLLDMITMTLGGHAAEHVALDDIYTGSTSDLKRATELSRRMVTQFGMSDSLGTIYLGSDDEVFVGRDFGHAREYSEEVANQIDKEVRKLLDACYQKAINLLKENIDKLHLVAQTLLAEETLSREEFIALVDKGELPNKQQTPLNPNIVTEEENMEEQIDFSGEEKLNFPTKPIFEKDRY
ncbi:MAG: ATP-dependent zinc metalloprotease FtsH, partial [Clostridiales bacterium]|nr:ATP-dependent zinc metalloprotease FtsH [Clostridiales bacterium]